MRVLNACVARKVCPRDIVRAIIKEKKKSFFFFFYYKTEYTERELLLLRGDPIETSVAACKRYPRDHGIIDNVKRGESYRESFQHRIVVSIMLHILRTRVM